MNDLVNAEFWLQKSAKISEAQPYNITNNCAYQALGHYYYFKNMTNLSITNYIKAAKMDQNYSNLQYDVALVCFKSGKLKCSLKYINKAINLTNNSDYFILKSYILLLNAKYDDAKKILINYHNPLSLAGQGHIYLAQNKSNRAIKLLNYSYSKIKINNDYISNKYVNNDFLNYFIPLGVGWFYANQNLHTDAIKYYEEIIEKDPNNILAKISKINSLIELKELKIAKKLFDKLNKEHPNNNLINLTYKRLNYNKDEYN
jgi:tetratricopeptide (TPR) repeat protein